MRRLIRALKRRRDEFVMRLVFYAVALLVVLSGIAFLAISSYLFLSLVLPLAQAALVAGSGMVIFALLLVAVAGLWFKRPKPRLSSRRSGHRLETELGEALGSEASTWVSKYGKEASLAAFAIGVASGFSPRLRRTLLGLARDVRDLLGD